MKEKLPPRTCGVNEGNHQPQMDTENRHKNAKAYIDYVTSISYLPCKRSPKGGKLNNSPIPNSRKAIILILPIGSDFPFHDHDKTAHKINQTIMAVVVTPEREPVGL